jgi:hypothetical protein
MLSAPFALAEISCTSPCNYDNAFQRLQSDPVYGGVIFCYSSSFFFFNARMAKSKAHPTA